MTVPSPRLRTAWRVGSALAAAAGSAVVTNALVNRTRNRSQSKADPADDGTTPEPAILPTTAAPEITDVAPPAAPVAELLVADPAPAASQPVRSPSDDLARAIQAAEAVESGGPSAWARVASELRARTTSTDAGWTSPTTRDPGPGEAPAPAATTAAPTAPAAATTNGATQTAEPAADVDGSPVWDYGLSGVDTRVPRLPGEPDTRRRYRRQRRDTSEQPAAPAGPAGSNGSGATTTTPAPPAPPSSTPPGDGDVAPDRRMLVFIGVAVAIALVLGLAVVVLGGGDDDRPEASSNDGGTDRSGTAGGSEPTAPTTPVAQLAPGQAFVQAAQRLQSAGTFAYEGTSSATDVSPVRPGPWAGVNLTVEGQVQLLTPRLFERGTAEDGTVVETVTDGVTIWGRTAPSFDGLGGVNLETLYSLPEPTPAKVGALLLPQWFTAAAGAADAGPDTQGRRTFRATLPAGVLGAIEDGQAPIDAVMVLTLDQDGDPAHVEVSTATAPQLRLVYDITQVGDELPIQIPGQTTGQTTGQSQSQGPTGTGATATTAVGSP